MSELQRWLAWGRVQVVGKTLLRAGGAVEVSEQPSGSIHVGRLTDLRKISDAVGYGVRWDERLHAGRRLGDAASPSCEVDEVFPGPGVDRLAVKNQRVNIWDFVAYITSFTTIQLCYCCTKAAIIRQSINK